MHPRDQYVTIFGKKPVLQALKNESLRVVRLFLPQKSWPWIIEMMDLAQKRKIEIRRMPLEKIHRISRNAKHDQGVAADILNVQMGDIEHFWEKYNGQSRLSVLALDHITTPANVGMIIRTATALGWHAILLPRVGCPDLGPLVIKASAGVVFEAPIIRIPTLEQGVDFLVQRGFSILGLDAHRGKTIDLYCPRAREILVLGNESLGISPQMASRVNTWLRIPMTPKVESLNVAAAAAIACHLLSPLSPKDCS